MTTPLLGVVDNVPDNVPAPGLVLIATVTVALLDVTMLLPASCTVTVMAGVMVDPATMFVGCWPRMSLVAGPTVTSNALLTVVVRPAEVAVSVYAVPDLSILHAAKVTTPETAVLGFAVHVSAAPDVPVPEVIAKVTLALLVVTVFPYASWIATFGCVVHATPPVPPPGCVVYPSCEAAPAVTLNVLLVALVSPVLVIVRVYPLPDLLIDRSPNVATPLLAALDTVPDSAPPPGFVPIATLTFALLVVTVLLLASCTVTTIAGLIAEPATTAVGCCVYTTLVAAPATIVNVLLTAVVRLVPVALRVYPAPDLSILQPAKVARPATAALAFAVQVSTAPDVPVPAVIANVTVAVLDVVFPNASCTATIGCVVHAIALVPPPGCWVKASFAAAAALTVTVAVPVLVTSAVSLTVMVRLGAVLSVTPFVNT